DVDPKGMATLISRGAQLLERPGSYTVELYGDDWQIAAGHRIGVLMTCCNDEWWVHRPSGGNVAIKSASITLPFLPTARTPDLAGGPAQKLTSYLKNAPFRVAAKTVSDGTTPFDVVTAQPPRAGGAGASTGNGAAAGAAPAPQAPAKPTVGTQGRLTLSFGHDRRRLGLALRRGFRVRLRCTVRCDLTGRLTQRRGRRTVTVGRFTRRSVQGRTAVQLRFTKAARKRLRGARRVSLTLRVEARPAGGGTPVVLSRPVRMKR
ncbi:MAG: hypothetical protein AVDCRST_MAG30-658, partial [uncultured Solirubrobacteraceae bacterium]